MHLKFGFATDTLDFIIGPIKGMSTLLTKTTFPQKFQTKTSILNVYFQMILLQYTLTLL